MSDKFQKIDGEGYLINDQGARLDDQEFGREFLSSIHLEESFHLKAKYKDLGVFIEAFDEPLVARHVELLDNKISIDLPYDLKAFIQLETLCLDDWDRFHGLTEQNAPFVFNRQAQVEFFDLVEEFDDDSITLFGQRYLTPNYFFEKPEIKEEKFWSEIYRTEEPGWDLKEPSQALVATLPQLKLSKQRVLVLGCGRGHDAAFFAKQGHLVTAVDFSPEAIQEAKNLYGDLAGLEFIQADVFNLPKENFGPFDLVFEHTLFCAVDPSKRNDLIRVWKKQLVDGGHFLGVFFTMSKRLGPPYGGSEWEYKERLKNHFDFRYWTRWRHSLPRRQGKELVVYAQKKS